MQEGRTGLGRRVLGIAMVVVAVLGGSAAMAAAQGTTGSIAGVVTDQSKAALPGATVTVKETDTGQTRVSVTDPQGRFLADALAPGKYMITVELSGFQTEEIRALTLAVGQAAALTVQMQVGGISEHIVVTADSSIVATRQSSVSALVDQQQIRELPLNGRDFSQLTLLQLGVTSSPSTAQAVDRGMGAQISIAGARPNQISFQVDGADVNTQGNQTPGSASGGMLGVDTVREFQVLVNNYSAEYGRSTGGIVVVVTRSGTNSLTGSAFEFGRNSRFDSRTYFDDPTQPDPPAHAQPVRRHARRADRPRQDLLLRQLRRPPPDAGVDDDRQRAERLDARAARSERGDRVVPAVVSEGERSADGDDGPVHPADRQSDGREPGRRQSRSKLLLEAVAVGEVLLRQGAGRSAAADSGTGRPTPKRNRRAWSAKSSRSSRRRCSTTPRSPGTKRMKPPRASRTARSIRACSSFRTRGSARSTSPASIRSVPTRSRRRS